MSSEGWQRLEEFWGKGWSGTKLAAMGLVGCGPHPSQQKMSGIAQEISSSNPLCDTVTPTRDPPQSHSHTLMWARVTGEWKTQLRAWRNGIFKAIGPWISGTGSWGNRGPVGQDSGGPGSPSYCGDTCQTPSDFSLVSRSSDPRRGDGGQGVVRDREGWVRTEHCPLAALLPSAHYQMVVLLHFNLLRVWAGPSTVLRLSSLE